VQVCIAAGSAADAPGSEGLAWLTAQTLAGGGTDDRSASRISLLLGHTDADITVHVGPELSLFELRGPADALAPAIDALGELLTRPAFSASALEAARELALSGPTPIGDVLLRDLLYLGHPYGHAVEGRAGVLPLLDPDDVARFWEGRYVRSAVYLGATGPLVSEHGQPADTPAGQALATLQERLSELPARIPRDVTPRAVPTLSGRRLAVTTGPESRILLGQPTALTPTDAGWAAVQAGLPPWQMTLQPALVVQIIPSDPEQPLAALLRALHGALAEPPPVVPAPDGPSWSLARRLATRALGAPAEAPPDNSAQSLDSENLQVVIVTPDPPTLAQALEQELPDEAVQRFDPERTRR